MAPSVFVMRAASPLAVPTFIGGGQGVGSFGVPTTAATITGGVLDGDLLIATVGTWGQAYTAPAGWTLVTSGAAGAGLGFTQQGVYWAFASTAISGGGGNASVTFATGNDRATLTLVAYRGATVISPYLTTVHTTANPSIVAPSLTATAASLLVCTWNWGMFGNPSGPTGVATPPTGMTYGANATAAKFIETAVYHQTVAAGATGTRTLVAGNTSEQTAVATSMLLS